MFWLSFEFIYSNRGEAERRMNQMINMQLKVTFPEPNLADLYCNLV